MSLKEIKVKSLNEIIDLIDSKAVKKNDRLILNGNVLDAATLINKYSLKPCNDSFKAEYQIFLSSYQLFKMISFSCPLNEFIVSPPSMYGHIIIILNINGILVQLHQNQKTNYETRFKSSKINNYQNQRFVVLDIETTGLDPLVDDIIQICIYESNENKYVRYLPLNKKTKNTEKEINRISETTLKTKKPLSQKEVDEIIKQFNLSDCVIMIWTGKNLFDRLFLEVYFKENNLTGLEYFTFFNAKMLIDEFKDEIKVRDLSKDNVAYLYGINYHNSHDALEDCKIEKEIITNLLNKNIEPLKAEQVKDMTAKIISYYYKFSANKYKHTHDDTIGFKLIDSINAERMYYEFCEALKSKYGIILNDYDKNHKKRGAEWIDIHHVDEIIEHNIAVKTQLAQQNKNLKSLQTLEEFNKSNRLVYANKIEHFILHALLDMYKSSYDNLYQGGLHFAFGDILKLEIGLFDKDSVFFNLQNQKQKFYQYISFDNIVDIYTSTCCAFGLKNIQTFIDNYWKLNEYKYDKQKYEAIMDIINKKLN